MPNNYIDVDIIHRYLDGIMDRNTLDKFEQELASNSELAKEVQWQREFREAIFLTEKERLKKRAEQLMQKYKSKEKKEPKVIQMQTFWSPKVKYIAIAAMLLLTIGLTFLYLPTHQEVQYADHLAVPYSAPPSMRGIDEGTATWIEAYKSAKYTQVNTLLTQKEQDTFLNAQEKFYRALAYLYQENRQAGKAIPYLKQAKTENPKLYQENADWFMALAYIDIQEHAKAKQILEEIVAQKAWKNQEAQNLLEQL